MVRKTTWFLVCIISISSAFAKEKEFVSMSGKELKLIETDKQCLFEMKGADVKWSGDCSLENNDRISISTTILSFDVGVSALKMGASPTIDNLSGNSIEYIDEFKIFGKKLDDVFIINSIRSIPFNMQFRTLYSLEYGVIGFQRHSSEGLDSVWMLKEL
jgi:hypothetical protein